MERSCSILISCQTFLFLMFVWRITFSVLTKHTLSGPKSFGLIVAFVCSASTMRIQFSLSLCVQHYKRSDRVKLLYDIFTCTNFLSIFFKSVWLGDWEKEWLLLRKCQPPFFPQTTPSQFFHARERERRGLKNKSPFLAPYVLPSTTVLAAGRCGPSEGQLAK